MIDVPDGIGEDEYAEGNATAVPMRPRSERRAHQCHHDGCDSPCQWEVYLHLRYGRRHVAIESLKSTIKVCDRHRRAANDFLLSEHNKREISVKLAAIGRLGIDWDNAMVEFVPVGEQSWGPQNMQPVGADMVTLGSG